jgi:hypothetical protein
MPTCHFAGGRFLHGGIRDLHSFEFAHNSLIRADSRNLVERLWNRLKEWRAVATRYEKTARSFMGVLWLWIKT